MKTYSGSLVLRAGNEVGSVRAELDVGDLGAVRIVDIFDLLARLDVVLGHLAGLVTSDDEI